MRIGGSLLMVEAMRAGKTPQEACEAAGRRVPKWHRVAALCPPAHVAFLALDPAGQAWRRLHAGNRFPLRGRPKGYHRGEAGGGNRLTAFA